MSFALPDVLAHLSKDHVAFRRALNILDRQIEMVAQYRDPDFETLNGIVAYFREYPLRFHHPVEHLIYAALQNRVPAVAEGIAAVEQQHDRIAAELEIFAKAVRDVLADVEISRRGFCNAARAFIAFERNHIRGEENSLFAMAISNLLPNDWLLIDSEARRIWTSSSQQSDMWRLRKGLENLELWDVENAPSVSSSSR